MPVSGGLFDRRIVLDTSVDEEFTRRDMRMRQPRHDNIEYQEGEDDGSERRDTAIALAAKCTARRDFDDVVS